MSETIKILFVDDEERLRQTCQRLLINRGYDVVTAENGQVALEMLGQEPFDLIILDLKMPVMGGEEVLGISRQRYPDIPVIIVTGHGTMTSAVACMKKGAYDIITKPFDLDRILPVIKRALEKRDLEQKNRQFQNEMMRTLFDLNTEKKRLETIINCMANGIMVTNQDLKVVLHNPSLMRLLGRSDHIVNPFPVSEILDDDSLIETLNKIQSGESLEDQFVSQEIRVKDTFLRAISAPALGPDRNVFWTVVGAVTILEDITAFKQLDQMKSDFMNMVAHELRSPLVSIRQLNSVLTEGLAGPLKEKQQDFVNRVTRKIDALLELVNELLDVAKIEAGKYVQQQVPTDMGQIIEEMVALMKPRAKEQKIVLTYSCENLKPIQADPKCMEEMLNNLVSNAINYSPEGGQVKVIAQGQDKYLEIKVMDEGVGIPPEELPKIFDKFYRVKHPKTRNVMGTGLGLSIVKGIVDAHHGTIEVESVLDKGTTFRILFPSK